MLGPLEVHAGDGSRVQVRGARLRTLMILLALRPGQVVPAARLAGAIWAKRAPAGSANALHALVSRLRRAVPDAVVTADSGGYQLMLDPDEVDALRFERLAAQGRARLGADPAAAADALRAALALWRGPALVDVAGANFARATIARLSELRLAAIEARVDAELRLAGGVPGASGPLVAELEGLVATHPLRESLIARLMRALAAAGRPGAALTVYEQTRTRLADQLGADPSIELAALHLEILRSGSGQGARNPRPAAGRPAAGESPAAGAAVAVPVVAVPAARKPIADEQAPEPDGRAGTARATNLRAELTSFVGRDRELADVGRLLAEHRLTTLTGPGGAGKTRLAVKAAWARVPGTPDGVWLVEFAPVTDPGQVAPAVLAALGLREQALMRAAVPGPTHWPASRDDTVLDPAGRLLAALHGKRALLVLDNCEHIVAAVAELAHRILGACPGVRVLTTSREPLNITGEALYPVGTLALPPVLPTSGPADPASIIGYAAVQLLVARARAVRPDFAVGARNAGAIAHICRALDGMPLAIELAAARLRSLSPEQVAERLDDRFRLLTGGSRTALPRHQILRAALDWSWDLLDEAERALCRRFSIFAGGATLETVERVCAGGPIAAEQVLALLGALLDKSLLTVRHRDGGPRYRMLEIIKAYGQERLAEAGEHDELRRAHAAYFLDLAEQASEYLLGGDQLVWLARLADDHDNFNAAIHAAIAAGDADTAVGVAGSLAWYWWLRGHKREGAELCRAALAVPGGEASEPRAAACFLGALLAIDGLRDPELAMRCFVTANELLTTRPENPLLRLVGPLKLLIDGWTSASQPPPSIRMLDAAVDDPHPWLASIARVIRGHVALNFGRQHAEAEADFLMALNGFRAAGDRWGLATTLASLATLAAWHGDFVAAVRDLEQGVHLFAELGADEDVVQFRIQLARNQWLLGERERARDCLDLARAQARRLGLPEPCALVAYAAADLARLDGDAQTARVRLAEATELAHSVTPHARAGIAGVSGYLAAAEGDLAEARSRHTEALRTALGTADAPVVAQALVGLADLALYEWDPERAAELLGVSVAVRGIPDLSLSDAVAVEMAARTALGDADFTTAYERGRAAALSTVEKLTGLPVPPTPQLQRSCANLGSPTQQLQ
jgi:predicted ATPase/DNA-binding SARP family transcriptional activator